MVILGLISLEIFSVAVFSSISIILGAGLGAFYIMYDINIVERATKEIKKEER